MNKTMIIVLMSLVIGLIVFMLVWNKVSEISLYDRLIFDKKIELHEDEYTYIGPISKINDLMFNFEVSKIHPKGFEMWIMTDSQFSEFSTDGTVKVMKHFTIYASGGKFVVSELDPKKYYYVLLYRFREWRSRMGQTSRELSRRCG